MKICGCNISIYNMAKPAFGKSVRFDWLFLRRHYAVRTVFMETVQAVYSCFGAKKFATKTDKQYENTINITKITFERI